MNTDSLSLSQRNIPIRGLRPIWYLVAVGGVMAYGWRKVFLGARERNELAREKMWARIHLIPLLQAEEDRDQVRRYYADLAREQQLLGSQSKPYNSDRYVYVQTGGVPRTREWYRASSDEEGLKRLMLNDRTMRELQQHEKTRAQIELFQAEKLIMFLPQIRAANIRTNSQEQFITTHQHHRFFLNSE